MINVTLSWTSILIRAQGSQRHDNKQNCKDMKGVVNGLALALARTYQKERNHPRSLVHL